MGGCTSKPKESGELHQKSLPSEPLDSPKDVEAEPKVEVKAEAMAEAQTVVEESKEKKDNGGEKQIEETLVDHSEPKQESGHASSDEPKPAIVELVSSDSAVEAAQQNNEDKVEIITAVTTATPVATKEEVKEKEAEAKVEDKTDAPLVTL